MERISLQYSLLASNFLALMRLRRKVRTLVRSHTLTATSGCRYQCRESVGESVYIHRHTHTQAAHIHKHTP